MQIIHFAFKKKEEEAEQKNLETDRQSEWMCRKI